VPLAILAAKNMSEFIS